MVQIGGLLEVHDLKDCGGNMWGFCGSTVRILDLLMRCIQREREREKKNKENLEIAHIVECPLQK